MLEGKRRKAALAPPKPPKLPPILVEERIYTPEWFDTAYEKGILLGENTAKKLWRSGWRGATVHDDKHHLGFVAGFTKTLAELWRAEP